VGAGPDERPQRIRPPAALEPFPEDQEQNDHQRAEHRPLVRGVMIDEPQPRGTISAGCGVRVRRHDAAPTFGRQLSNRRSHRSRMPTQARPAAVNTSTPKNITSISNVLPAAPLLGATPAAAAASPAPPPP